jgi:membrane-bound ClpP family serine protease
LSILVAQAGNTAPEASNGATWLAIGFGLGILALLLFGVEIFLPTGGMIGILCGLSAIASIISFFQFSPSAGGFAILVYLVATPFLLVYGVKLWSHSPLGRRLILGGTDTIDGRGLDEDEVRARLESEARATQSSGEAMVGMTAVTASPLRPVGAIRFEGRRMDALAESGVIDEGVEVEIVSVVDNQIKVRQPSASGHATD